jgi:hypothetical protein
MFKYVIKGDEKFDDTINNYLFNKIKIKENSNEIIKYILSIKKNYFYYFNKISNLCSYHITRLNMINEVMLEKNEIKSDIPNSKNFLKNKNELNDIEYYLYNIYYNNFIKRSINYFWVNKIINFDIFHKIFIKLFTPNIFSEISTMKNYTYNLEDEIEAVTNLGKKVEQLLKLLDSNNEGVGLFFFRNDLIKEIIRPYLL